MFDSGLQIRLDQGVWSETDPVFNISSDPVPNPVFSLDPYLDLVFKRSRIQNKIGSESVLNMKIQNPFKLNFPSSIY